MNTLVKSIIALSHTLDQGEDYYTFLIDDDLVLSIEVERGTNVITFKYLQDFKTFTKKGIKKMTKYTLQ